MSDAKQETLITDVQDAQPMTDDGNAQTQSGNQSAKSKSKGKGKKKPSKKELARRRREKAEQERLEQLQREKELEEKRIHEQEMEMERREQQRLQEEFGDITNLRTQRIDYAASVRAEKAKQEEWDRYVSCDHSTNPLDQADVNSFISIWEDIEDNDMGDLFAYIEKASKLLDQLKDLRSKAEVSLNMDAFTRFSEHINDIRRLIQNKIEKLTCYQLLFSEKYASAKNEVLLSSEGGGYGYGLWVNLAKNPRVSNIDFGIVSMDIYKTVAQAAIAIRVTTSPLASEFQNYMLLSPVLACEFYQLPPPPKKIGTMVLRQVATQQNLQTVQYPLKTAKPNEVQPPIVFKMKIDVNQLPEDQEMVTVIKLDDIKNTQTQISDVEIDKETGILKFSSKTTGLFALAMPKYSHFPLQFWEISSTKEDSCEVFIRTALTDLCIEIDSNGLCSMEGPVAFSGLTAPAAIEYMHRHGLNIVAPETISEFGDELAGKLSQKSADLEDVLAYGIADAATGFRIRSSKWNSQLPEDRAMLLAREIVEYGEPTTEDEQTGEEEEDKPEHHAAEEEEHAENKAKSGNTKWHCILAKAKHINEVNYAENADEADTNMKRNTTFHQHLLPMLMDMASSAVQGRTRNASCFVSETLRYILHKAKLFSTTI